MQKRFNLFKFCSLVLGLALVFSCSNDEPNPDLPLTGEVVIIELNSAINSSVSGSATFEQREDNSTLITLRISGTKTGVIFPSSIHFNSIAEGGDLAISLTDIDGTTGKSTTIVTKLNNGSPVSYNHLLDFDGHIMILDSSGNTTNPLIQEDIGQNVLTGNQKVYLINSVSDPNIKGTVTFAERENRETLITVDLINDNSATQRPGHIHRNTAAEDGEIAVRLKETVGGKSSTNVSELEDGTIITYDELIQFDGYVNIHASFSQISVFVAQGDIGQNALTGENITYTLIQKDGSGISGVVKLYERVNGETLAIAELLGTAAGNIHPGHIHANTAILGGEIVYILKPINGETGKSVNNISMLDNGLPITFTELLSYNGHVNIHLSMDDLKTLVAQGNIGRNAD